MSFKELLQSVGILCENQRTVKGICEDHREVKADWLYLARKGERFNGADYIETCLLYTSR